MYEGLGSRRHNLLPVHWSDIGASARKEEEDAALFGLFLIFRNMQFPFRVLSSLGSLDSQGTAAPAAAPGA